MMVSVHDVAAVLRERLPGIPGRKLHPLLYYCQGHHVAAFGVPLFAEGIAAGDAGPVVTGLGGDEPSASTRELSEAELNTIGYVLSRYGTLTARDLEHLSHAETPCRRAAEARAAGLSARIELTWLREYFGAGEEADGDLAARLDPQQVRAWLADAPHRKAESGRPDELEVLRARLGASA